MKKKNKSCRHCGEVQDTRTLKKKSKFAICLQFKKNNTKYVFSYSFVLNFGVQWLQVHFKT